MSSSNVKKPVKAKGKVVKKSTTTPKTSGIKKKQTVKPAVATTSGLKETTAELAKLDIKQIGVQIVVKEMEDVLIRDVGNKIADDGRWPLIIDETGQASIFIRYSDTNYLNAANPSNMEPEKMRIALLGAVRYGKPLVIDLMGCDMFHIVQDRFNEIKEGLLDWVLDKTFVTEEKFNQITKKEDGPEYEEKMFWARMAEFKFWLMTNSEPEPELLEKFYVIRVKPSPPKE